MSSQARDEKCSIFLEADGECCNFIVFLLSIHFWTCIELAIFNWWLNLICALWHAIIVSSASTSSQSFLGWSLCLRSSTRHGCHCVSLSQQFSKIRFHWWCDFGLLSPQTLQISSSFFFSTVVVLFWIFLVWTRTVDQHLAHPWIAEAHLSWSSTCVAKIKGFCLLPSLVLLSYKSEHVVQGFPNLFQDCSWNLGILFFRPALYLCRRSGKIFVSWK